MQAVIERPTTYDLSRFDRTVKAGNKAAVATKKAKKKTGVTISGFSILCAVVVFGMLTALLFSYVNLTEVSETNRRKKAELEKLREEVQMLEIERDQRMGAMQIREMAVTQLGMSKIDKSQITYVTTSCEDKFEHAGTEKREAPKVVSGLIKGFSTIVEFMN